MTTPRLYRCNRNQKKLQQQQQQKQHINAQYNSNEMALDWRNVQGKLYNKSNQIDQLFQAYQRQKEQQHRSLSLSMSDDNDAGDTIFIIGDDLLPASSQNSSNHNNHNSSNSNNNELVLITGPSGVGKTALALTLQEKVQEDGGYFVQGKFEQPTNSHINSSSTTTTTSVADDDDDDDDPYYGSRKVDSGGVHGPFASALSQYASLLLSAHHHHHRNNVSQQQRQQHRGEKEDETDPKDDIADNNDDLTLFQAALQRELDTSELQVLAESIPELQTILHTNSNNNNIGLLQHPVVANSSRRDQQLLQQPLHNTCNSHHQAATTTTTATTSCWRGLQGPDAEKCFHHIVSKLIAAICGATPMDHPLVFLFDDLQWADARALGLIKAILTRQSSTSTKGLLLICTLRSTEELGINHDDDDKKHQQRPAKQEVVELSKLLSETLDELRNVGVRTSQIHVPNLCEDGVGEFVRDVLPPSSIASESHRLLCQELYQQTKGNAFYMSQLLRYWEGKGLFQSQSNALGNNKQHFCLVQAILNDVATPRSVLDLVAKKMLQLPLNAREVLKMAACMGTTVSKSLLQEAGSVGLSPLQVKPALLMAHEHGLIDYDESTGTIRFVHDVIQQAAYSLIPEAERANLHLHIGRALWVWLSYEELEINIFLVTNQITQGLHLVDDQVERDEMAELFYRAGQRASHCSSFSQASDYYKRGIRLLGRKHWKRHYRLSLNFYNAAAEVEYYEGNLARVDSLLSSVLKHAKTLEDKLHAHYTQIYSLASRDDLDKTFSIGFEVLKQLGVTFPNKLRAVRTRIAWHGCLQKLHRLSDNQIMSLPVMQDNRQLIIMRLLNTLMMSAFSARQELVLPILIRTVQLTLQNGICGASCISLGYLGSHMGRHGHVNDGHRFVRLGLRIMERFDAKEWQSRLALGVYGGFYTMRHPLRDSIKPLLAARRAGLVVGDLHSSVVCASLQSRVSLCAAMSLPELLDDLRRCRRMCVQYSQDHANMTMGHQEQLCLNFMGKSQDPVIMTGDAMNEEETIRSLQGKHPVFLAWLFLMKHMLAVYFHEFQEARFIENRLRALKVDAILEVSLVTHLFLEGLTAAALSHTGGEHATNLCRAQRICKRLKVYQTISSENFTNKVCLLEAEIAVLHGDRMVAQSKYQEAIAVAKKEHFLHEQALACERAGQAMLEWGDETMGRDYLKQACSIYEEWGAHAKVWQLEQRFSNLWKNGPQPFEGKNHIRDTDTD